MSDIFSCRYGISHRDLKPENIMMSNDTEEAQLKIADFNLSIISGPKEKATEPFGTLVSSDSFPLSHENPSWHSRMQLLKLSSGSRMTRLLTSGALE